MRMNWPFVFLSAFLAGAGVAILILFDFVLHVDHTKWWHYLGSHVGALLASIGSVGLAFELLNRSVLGEQWIANIRHAFAEDPHLARRLNDEAREERVRFTLEAQLDREKGDAIFFAMVRPYMNRTRRFREQKRFDLRLEDLFADVTLQAEGNAIRFSKESYHRLTVHYTFERAFESQLNSVICILADEYDEITSSFSRPGNLYREVVCISDHEAAQLKTLLDGCSAKRAPSIIAPLFKLSVAINGTRIAVKSGSLSENGKSIILTLDVPRLVSLPHVIAPSGKAIAVSGTSGGRILEWNPEKVEYDITIEALRAKAVRRLPLLLPEPTAQPTSRFFYPPSICNVVPAPFFDAEPPFANVRHDVAFRTVEIEMSESDTAKRWVFPPAGVIYTWDLV